ncbi:MAG TPA: 3-hydroxyacyl-CoA dehydrogenase family protein [Acidimicrobiales bacterium]|nr:3-hydroxyacyl-CoA dehydrogenase family protein [Acidimicrobiales bacterium]
MTTTIKSVGIAGSGLMAAGIAEVMATTGHEVVMRCRSQGSADKVQGKIEGSLARQLEKGTMGEGEHAEVLDRIHVTTDLERLDVCELVIETVVEDLAVKKDLFRQLDDVCRDDAILTTNTSTLPVVEMAMATDRPERVLGLHFFNPATKMPLVEVVPAITTAPEVVDTVREFAVQCRKEPVTVKDSAGFIVNALLFPYLNSAVKMLESGVATKEDIDAAMKGGCGFPMGPLALLDLIGLDTSVAVLHALQEERNDSCCNPAPLLKRMVTARQLGRKTGQGFYTYPARH